MGIWKDLLGTTSNTLGIGKNKATISASGLTAARTVTLPDQSGTVAMTGAITTSGLTMATLRLLGRSSVGAGAVEEFSVGANLALVIAAGVPTALNVTASGSTGQVQVNDAGAISGFSGFTYSTSTGDITVNGVRFGRGNGALNTNTAAGTGALAVVTNLYNSAFGYNALNALLGGTENAGFGVSTLLGLTTGNYNTAHGSGCLYTVTTGSQNTGIGRNTGAGITTGSSNTILGANVSGLAAGLSNNIIISDGAGNIRIQSDANGNVTAGTASLATTATDGFFRIPTCAGVPTGTPTAITGFSPLVVDSTNGKMYFYSGGAWRILN